MPVTTDIGYPWISFTTDYGLDDGFVAACTGVIAGIAPATRVLDVTHTVPAQDIRHGATVLAHTAPYLPPAVHLAVVDPGVGTQRRGVVIVAGDSLLVGPDNGLLVPAAEALGGPRAAFTLNQPRFWLPTVTRTFHGRDLFAPVAAWLATGVEPRQVGSPLPVTELLRLPEPLVDVDADRVRAEVVTVDHFGNLQLAVAAHQVPWQPPTPLRLTCGGQHHHARLATTFADVGEGDLLALVDSAGYLALAVNGGSAASALGLRPGAVVHAEPAPGATQP